MNSTELGTLLHKAIAAVVEVAKCDSGTLYVELAVKVAADDAVKALAEALLGTQKPSLHPSVTGDSQQHPKPSARDVDAAIAAFEASEESWALYKDYEKREMAFKAGMRFAAQHQPRLSVTLPQRLVPMRFQEGEYDMVVEKRGEWIRADIIKARLINIGITVHEEA